MEKKLAETKMNEEELVEYIKKQREFNAKDKAVDEYARDMMLKFGY